MSFSSRHCFEACHFRPAFSTFPLQEAKKFAGISLAAVMTKQEKFSDTGEEERAGNQPN
jgi:hypothetical protein